MSFFFFQAEDGIRDDLVTGVQTCALPISPIGTLTEFTLPTPKSEPYGITAGPDGDLWFTEFQGNQIGRITPIGTLTEFRMTTPATSPNGITRGPDGNFWFTEDLGNKIGRIKTRQLT